MNLPKLAQTALAASCLSLFCPFVVHAGPTPYPAQTDEAAWPGAGPIRVGNWMNDNRAYSWTLREKDQAAVVFVGDSLVGGWKSLGKAFPGIKVANRGIGGDVSRGVLFRFQGDGVDLNPSAIVYCVGSNDLSAHGKAADTVANIAATVDLARKANPNVPIILCTIPPRNAPNAPILPGALDSLNSQLKTYAIGKPNMVVLDLFSVFATPEGGINPEFIGKDGIHITPAGYEKWAALLRPVLTGMGVVATLPATP